jgi:hypothetical protein
MAKKLLAASLEDQVKWQFAVTRGPETIEIFSIEAVLL